MNVNFKLNREEENFLVSNERGIMEIRKYQDNMEDILKWEDVIEKQEENLEEIKEKRNTKMQKLNKIVQALPKAKIEDLFSWIFLLFFVPGVPFLTGLAYIIFVGDADVWFIIVASTLVCGIFDIGAFTGAFFPFQYRKKKKIKQELEKDITDLNLEISCFEQLLTKNQFHYQKLLDEKRKDNIQNASTAVQAVSYKEELEFQKALLNQMLKDNRIKQQEVKDAITKDDILSRIRKFKKEN